MKTFARSVVVLALAGSLSVPLAGADAAAGGSLDHARSATSAFGHTGTVVDSRTETDLATGEVSTRTRIEEYDNRGRLVHTLELDTETTDQGEVVTYRAEGTHELSDTGTRRSVYVVDQDGDGPLPADVIVTTFTFDNRDVLVAVETTYDYGADGTIDSVDHETYTSTQRRRTSTAHVELGNGPGPEDDEVIDTTYTYDKHGNVIAAVEDLDLLATPQSPDSRFEETSVYSRSGDFVSAVDSSYTFDEQGTQQLAERYTYETSRTQSGSVVTDHSTADFDGDGVVDGVQDTVTTYDGNLPTSTVNTVVEGGVTTVRTEASTYDQRGNLLTFHAETTVDDALESATDESYTFDKRGRILGWVITDDFDGDGAADEVAERVYTSWDQKGRFTSYVTTIEDGAGNLLERSESSIVWTRDYETRTSLVDEDGDGTFDTEVVTVIPLVFG